MASSVKGDPHNQTSLLKQPHIWRQIIGTALYQVIIMVLLFIFGGLATGSPKYYPYTNTANAAIGEDPVMCPAYPNYNENTGEYFDYTGSQLADEVCAKYIGANAKLTVLTYAFNTFCFMNLFNLINCRKLGAADKNIFERFLHNWTFIGVMLGAFVAHICLVQFASVMLRTTAVETRGEWGGAIAVGASVLAIGILLKLTPQAWVEMLPVDRFGVDEDTGVAKGTLADKVLEAKAKSGMEGNVDLDAIKARALAAGSAVNDKTAMDDEKVDPEADANDNYGRRYN
jgi:magnesium-transporting ATPase (P-type)